MSQTNNEKKITIEYYSTCTWEKLDDKKNSSVRACTDISLLLERLRKTNVQDRKIIYNGENLVLSSIEYNSVSKLWELIFFKSRSSAIPFISTSNGDLKQIKLDKGDTISEVLCAEYNPALKILAMQRNAYAFGTKGLELFFSKFLEFDLFLDSIQTLNEEKKSVLKKSKLKKFKLHVKNVGTKSNNNNTSRDIVQYGKNTSICRAIDSALAVDSSIINIEFSMANSSRTINIQDEDFEIFQDLMNNNNVKCFELGLVPDEYSTMQVTDFMDFRVHDIINVPFIKGKPLDTSEILKNMTDKFQENIYLK